MTVALVSTTQVFTGLSSDSKPSDGTIVVGSQFTELDTGVVSAWGGPAVGWYVQDPGGQSAAMDRAVELGFLSAMLRELSGIRQVLELANELDAGDLETGDFTP